MDRPSDRIAYYLTIGDVSNITVFPVGYVLDSRYEILSPLGQGSFGAVYRVKDHHTGQVSALKILNPSELPRNEIWREAQTLAGLEGEYILPVRNASHVSGVPYIVTEVAECGSVGARIEPCIGVPVEQAIRWMRHVCRGVARLHDVGLVHNDLKPDNLFLNAQLDALVGDLGLASKMDADGQAAFGGTPVTMAPEVAIVGAGDRAEWATASPANVRTDVYSLGATLFCLLAGVAPYNSSGGALATMTAVATSAPLGLANLAPHIPRPLLGIVHKAMHRDPIQRYASASELDAALGRFSFGARIWNRVTPHPLHEMCFVGAKGKSQLSVCAVVCGNVGATVEIQIYHTLSGRKTHQPWKRCSRQTMPNEVRKVLKAST